MKMTMLGSGGVTLTPRPSCNCRICVEAKVKGIPYSRTGTSLFIHDMNLLFDTPEEVRLQLTRENIDKVEHVILTHWHPDHTHGIRVLEQLNWSFPLNAPFGEPIKVYISKWQHETLKKYSCGSFLDYYVEKKMISLVYWEDKQVLEFPTGIKITPYLIDFTKGFYYLIENKNSKVIYAPCEYHHLLPDPSINNVDTFIVHNLFWENPNVSPRKRAPTDEDSFEQMLGHSDSFGAKNIILTHIEESFGLNHDELNEKMRKFYPNHNIIAGYDGLKLDF